MTQAAQTFHALFVATLGALQAQPNVGYPASNSVVAMQCCVLAMVILVFCSALAAALYVMGGDAPKPVREKAETLTEVYEQLEGRESSDPFAPNVWHTVHLRDEDETEGE